MDFYAQIKRVELNGDGDLIGVEFYHDVNYSFNPEDYGEFIFRLRRGLRRINLTAGSSDIKPGENDPTD